MDRDARADTARQRRSCAEKIAAAGKEPAFYFVLEVKHPEDGQRLGYRLTKIDSWDKTETYDIDAFYVLIAF